jgi:hypothetical protein
MGSRKIKQDILAALKSDAPGEIRQYLDSLPVKDVVNGLFSAICRGDETVRWNGIISMGYSVARLADEDMEEARIVMRRLLWSLNDESGGIGWGAPESLAEIMVCHDGLAQEYVHMLVSYMQPDGEELFQDGNQLEHEILQRGLLWGIGRLAEEKSSLLRNRDVPVCLVPYLDSADPTVRGLAARSLGLLQYGGSVEQLEKLQGDLSMVKYYDNGRLLTVSVDDLVCQALERIREQGGER